MASGGFVPALDVEVVDQPESHRVVGHARAGTSYLTAAFGGT
jgi:hypothetical protein